MPQPMITFVRRRWDEAGGAEHYLSRLVERLGQMGYRCRLLCESWKQPGAPFERIDTLSTSGFPHTRPEEFANGVNRIPRKDLGIVFSLERGISAPIYRAGDGLHCQWLAYRAGGRFWGRFRNAISLKNHVIHAMEKQTFDPSVTGTVIANSEMVKREILEHSAFPSGRIVVIPNGVDASYFGSGSREKGRAALGWGQRELVCLLVGRGRQRKGHEQARRVVDQVSVPMRLAIVDSAPPCPMPDLYAAADIFLFPTLYDPFANVTLEAMAAGLPVITTRCNGAMEVIDEGENGFLVGNAFDIAKMASLLEELADRERRKAMGQAARVRARRCTWEKHLEATLEVIHSV